MPPLRVGQRVPVVDQRVASRLDEVIAARNHLPRHTHDDRALGNFGARWHQGHRANHAASSDFRSIHYDRANADQAVVADLGAVHHGPMSYRDVIADHRPIAAADMNHDGVLDIAPAADAHRGALGADHAVRPETAALARADAAEDTRGGIDEGGLFELHLGAEFKRPRFNGHGRTP